MDSQNEPAGMIGRKPSYVRSILRFLAPPKEQETVKVINDKELKVLQRGTEKIVKLDQIYGESSSSTRDFFSKEFKSSAKQCLNGSNYAFLFTGETSSDKLRLMCGDEKQAGIGDLFVDEIFSLRNDQQKPIVTMQFVSIAGDLISDLVNPKNQFHISVDMTLDGVMIQHNSDVNVRNRDDFRRSMMEGMRVLRESPEKAALRSVFVILEIRNKDLFSRVIFACLPGFERLGVDPQVLRAREGPIANMELLAFAAVLNRMAFADEGSASYCDFSMSKTTYLLEEALGARMPLKTLEIASAIRRVANYPIQNNVASNKVFQRLRRTIAYMKQRNQTVNTSSHLGSDRDAYDTLNAKVFHEHVRQERGSIDEIIEQQTKIDALESNISKLIKHYRILYEYLMMSSLPEEAWPAVLKEREIEQLQNATTTQASNVGVLKTLFNRLRALQESIVESNDRQVKLVEENDRLKREGHRSDGSVSTIQKLQEHLDKMFAEQVAKSSKSDRQKILDLQDEIAVLKSKNQRLEQRSQEGDPDVKRRLQEQLSQKDGEIRRMKEESMSLREKIHDLQKKAKAPKTPREKQDAKAISNQLAEFSAGQIQQLERENAELRTKLLQCETELQNCEEFMKEQITSYQNQIISLKKELAALKQTNSSQPRAAW
eukprot:jgi/Bigna1/68849/fgenesh1_pg.7_\